MTHIYIYRERERERERERDREREKAVAECEHPIFLYLIRIVIESLENVLYDTGNFKPYLLHIY